MLHGSTSPYVLPSNSFLEAGHVMCDWQPVDTYPSNSLGFSDVRGNVWEWTEDHVTALATPFHTSYLYDDYSTSFFDGRHNVIAVSHAVNCCLPGSGFCQRECHAHSQITRFVVLFSSRSHSGWINTPRRSSTATRKLDIFKNKDTPSRTLLQTLDLENFARAYRPSKRVINLARERWTSRAS